MSLEIVIPTPSRDAAWRGDFCHRQIYFGDACTGTSTPIIYWNDDVAGRKRATHNVVDRLLLPHAISRQSVASVTTPYQNFLTCKTDCGRSC